MPGNHLLLQPDPPLYTILAISDELLQHTAQERQHVVGKSFFEVYPENLEATPGPGLSNLRLSFQNALQHKHTDQMPLVRYHVPAAEGGLEERYWSATSKPVLDAAGKVLYILYTTATIGDQTKSEKRESTLSKIEKQYSLFMQAPVAIGILVGSDHTVELANEEMLKILGRTPEIIGKPILESLPEVREQGLSQLLDQVRKTGEPSYDSERPTTLLKDGKEETRYYNFVYQPYYENTGDQLAAGVFCVANDVTEQVLARKKVEESEQQVRSFVESAPFPIAVYVGKEMRIQFANQAMISAYGKGKDVIGRLYEAVMPEMSPEIYRRLDQVFTTGAPFHARNERIDVVMDGKQQSFFYDYSFVPLFDVSGKVYGIMNTAADVTDLNLAHIQMEEKEARYRTLIEEAPVATALYLGKELRIQYANDIMLEYWGKDSSVVGKTLQEALPELKHQSFPVLLESVYNTGEPYKGVKERVDFVVDGMLQPFYFNYTYKPLRNGEGEVYGLHHTAIDVTEEVLAQKKLEDSESRFRKMVEQAPIAIAVFRGHEFVAEVANDFYLSLVDKTKEELLGKPLFEALPEVKETLEPITRELVRTGVSFPASEFEVVLKRNGKAETCYFNSVWEPYFENDGSINGFIVVANEVTEQVQNRKKIEESAQELGKLANAMPQIVWIAEPDGKVVYYNDRVSEFAGAKKLPSGDWSWEGLLFPEDVEPTVEAWKTSVAEGTIYQIEHRVQALDGTYRWYLSRALPQYDVEGSIVKWYGTATDVHERKIYQETLEMKNAHLTLVNNDLDNFIYTASHDLKAPIFNIEGLVALLSEEHDAGRAQEGEAQFIMEMMKGSIDRFKKTIDSLTDIVKLQQENESEAVVVNLQEVIQEVTLDLEPIIRSADAELIIDVAGCSSIHFTKKNLRSVIYNLLSNAIKYSSPERRPRVQISCQEVPPFDVLTVVDNGLGMDLKDTTQLFAMFKRFHDHVEGTGIGLYMVKKMVESAKGRIEVESQVGIGTTFRVYFPHRYV